MKLAKRIDENGYFIEDILDFDKDNLSSDLILDDVPQGLHKPKWSGSQWIEGKLQEEIEAIKEKRLEQQEWAQYLADEQAHKKQAWINKGRKPFKPPLF